MKLIIAILLAGITTIASATEDRTPSAVSARLYTDCIKADTLSARIVLTPAGINAYVQAVDTRCLVWTIIWYPALMGQALIDVNEAKLQQFGAKRLKFLQDLTSKIQVAARQ